MSDVGKDGEIDGMMGCKWTVMGRCVDGSWTVSNILERGGNGSWTSGHGRAMLSGQKRKIYCMLTLYLEDQK